MTKQVNVNGAIYREVPIPFWSRIFSWPWRPFTKSYRIRDYQAEVWRDWDIRQAAKRQAAAIQAPPPVTRPKRVPEAIKVELSAPVASAFAAPAPATGYDPVTAMLIVNALSSSTETAPAPVFASGGGGEFDGGGSSGRWDPAPAPAYEASAPAPAEDYSCRSSDYSSSSYSSSDSGSSSSYDSGSSYSSGTD